MMPEQYVQKSWHRLVCRWQISYTKQNWHSCLSGNDFRLRHFLCRQIFCWFFQRHCCPAVFPLLTVTSSCGILSVPSLAVSANCELFVVCVVAVYNIAQLGIKAVGGNLSGVGILNVICIVQIFKRSFEGFKKSFDVPFWIMVFYVTFGYANLMYQAHLVFCADVLPCGKRIMS